MMKRRVFGMLLSLCLVLMLIPAAAFAEDAVQTISLTAPYTTTVEQGGSAKPGKTVFKLKLMDNEGKSVSLGNAEITGTSVTTNGVDSYPSKLTLTGTYEELVGFTDGVYVQQVDEGKDGWDYDDTVWCLVWNNAPVAYSLDDAAPVEYKLLIYPTIYEEKDNGGRFYYRVEEKDPLDQMTFTNTYTKSTTETPVPSESAKPSVSPEPTNPGKATPAPDVTDLPKTGDSSSLTGWLALLAVSAAGVAGAVVYGRRRKSAREK